MWTKISIAAVVVMLAGGFFAYKNNEALNAEIQARDTAKATLAQTNELLADEEAKLADATQKRNSYEADCKALQQKLDELIASNDAMTKAMGPKEEELKNMTAQLDSIKAKSKVMANVAETMREIDRMKEDNAKLKAQVDAASAKRDALVARIGQIDSGIAALNKLESDQRAHVSPASLKTSIRNVYDTWGFVVLDSGANAGIVLGSRLAVLRDGNKIAELSVSNVETGKSSADIIPSSLTEGIQIRPGDQVVAVRPQ
jgi:predicted RNase H-like nuclease (RuvC/YqgF family)